MEKKLEITLNQLLELVVYEEDEKKKEELFEVYTQLKGIWLDMIFGGKEND